MLYVLLWLHNKIESNKIVGTWNESVSPEIAKAKHRCGSEFGREKVKKLQK